MFAERYYRYYIALLYNYKGDYYEENNRINFVNDYVIEYGHKRLCRQYKGDFRIHSYI